MGIEYAVKRELRQYIQDAVRWLLQEMVLNTGKGRKINHVIVKQKQLVFSMQLRQIS
jgi:hypothetical protein